MGTIHLSSISDVNVLATMKEQIKNQVKANISWQERMELYRQVQFINERIRVLVETS